MADKKRILMAVHDRDRQSGYDRDNYAEDRFRDRTGREHYDNGRFAPTNDAIYGPYGHYDGSGWERRAVDAAAHHYPMTPFAPPVYRDNADMRYRDNRAMDKIGFSADGEIGQPWEMRDKYRMDAGYYSDGDMMPGKKSHMSDRGTGGFHHPLTKDMLEAWVAKMENADGSTGAHWTLEQTKQLQAQGIGLDPVKLWVAMDMMYSDCFLAAEKAGIGKPDFYADMAKAFLTDKDAQPDKLDRYCCAVAKRKP